MLWHLSFLPQSKAWRTMPRAPDGHHARTCASSSMKLSGYQSLATSVQAANARRRSSDDGTSGARIAAAGFTPSRSRATAGTATRPPAASGGAPAADIYSFLLASPQVPAAAREGSTPARQPVDKRFASRSQPARPAQTFPLSAAAGRPQLTVTIEKRQAPASPFASPAAPADPVAAHGGSGTAAAPSPAACATPQAQGAESATVAAASGVAATSLPPVAVSVVPAQHQSAPQGDFLAQLARLGGKSSI